VRRGSPVSVGLTGEHSRGARCRERLRQRDRLGCIATRWASDKCASRQASVFSHQSLDSLASECWTMQRNRTRLRTGTLPTDNRRLTTDDSELTTRDLSRTPRCALGSKKLAAGDGWPATNCRRPFVPCRCPPPVAHRPSKAPFRDTATHPSSSRLADRPRSASAAVKVMGCSGSLSAHRSRTRDAPE